MTDNQLSCVAGFDTRPYMTPVPYARVGVAGAWAQLHMGACGVAVVSGTDWRRAAVACVTTAEELLQAHASRCWPIVCNENLIGDRGRVWFAPHVGDAPWNLAARSVDVPATVEIVKSAVVVALQSHVVRGVLEDSRRVVFTPQRVSNAASHAVRTLNATDPYQWPRERELIWTVVKELQVGGACLELGVGDGETLAVIADAATEREVRGIDNFSYGGADQIARVASRTGVHVHESSTRDASWDTPLAFLHVDAGHDLDDCAHDLDKFTRFVVPGGVLAVDDYGTDLDQPGVRAATDVFIQRGGWAPITMGPKLALWRKL